MALPLDHLDLLDVPIDAVGGVPLSLPIADIDEDPAQPRHEFDDASLAELADTIRQRGVRQPISVRRHPAQPDRWMLNFGARRLRASKLAGKSEIPAFVDETADDYDQVIENEQREGLKALDLALFIEKRLTAGDSHQDIARRLGKSKTHITMVCAMIDPPDWLLTAYRSGRCRGVAELYELRRLHESRPDAVHELIARAEPVSRAAIRSIKAETPAERPQATAGAHAIHEPPLRATNRHATRAPLVDAATLQRRAELLCVELGSTLDRLRACAPDRVVALRDQLTALASRCRRSPV